MRASYERIRSLEGDDPTEVGGQVVAQFDVQSTSPVPRRERPSRAKVGNDPTLGQPEVQIGRGKSSRRAIACGTRAVAIDGCHKAVVSRDRGPVFAQRPHKAVESGQHSWVPLSFEANRKLFAPGLDLGSGAAETAETVGR